MAQGQQNRIDSLLGELENTGEDTNRVKTYDQLAYYYSFVEVEEGIRYARLTLELSEKIAWGRGKAMGLAELGINYAAKAEYGTAIHYYKRASQEFIDIGNKEGAAAVWANVGQLYLKQSDYPRALETSFKALQIYEESGNRRNVAVILETIGSIYYETKQYDQTLTYYAKALAINKESGDQRGVARNLGNEGRVYFAEKEYAKALDFYFAALEINKQLQNPAYIHVNLANIGAVYTEQKEYEKAIDYHSQALRFSEELDDRAHIAINCGNLGETYYFMAMDSIYRKSALRTGFLHTSISYLEKACSLCRELSMRAPHIEFARYLSEAYTALNQHGKALEVYKELQVLKDSVFSEDSKLLMARIEAKRSLDLKDKDLIIKEKQLEIARLEIINERNEKGIFIGAVTLLILISARIIRHYLKRQKAHRKTMDDIAGIHSHEIRGPLARIMGLSELINYTDPKDPANKDVLDGIRKSCIELDDQIEKIVNKSNSGR